MLSSMGFYPVDPSSQDYIIGSPVFDDVSLDMGNGKKLRIVATNTSTANAYIQSATLNGKPWNKQMFSHYDIKQGETFVITLGSQPNKKWGRTYKNRGGTQGARTSNRRWSQNR